MDSKVVAMRKYILSIMCLAFLSACGHEEAKQQNTASAESVQQTTQNVVKYKVTSYPYTPFVIRDNKGDVSGFETDILLAIAKHQHIQFEFTPMLVKWDILFDSIESKQADLLSAGMYPNPERRERFEVSEPYMYTQFALMSAAKIKVHGLADLKGKSVAVMGNSMAEKEIRALPYANEIKVKTIKSVYEGVKAVVSGEVDALYGDQVVLTYYANQFKDKKLNVNADPHAQQHQFVFLMTKGNTELLTKVNMGLAGIQADGTLDKIKKKWLGQ